MTRITVITECFVGQKSQVVKKFKKSKFLKGVSLLIFWIEKNAFLTKKSEVVKVTFIHRHLTPNDLIYLH